MTPLSDILGRLAERAEAATGPDRELDALIWCALHGVKYLGHHMAYASYGANPETQVEFTEPPRRTRMVSGNVRFPHAQPVTASLDAAMSLVPEGAQLTFKNIDPDEWYAIIAMPADSFGGAADAPAPALTAACLRARAAESEQSSPIDGETR